MMYFGDDLQPFDIIFDTGSNVLWIPVANCSGCPTANYYKFNNNTLNTTKFGEIQYGIGYVSGYYFKDNIRFYQTGFPLYTTILGVNTSINQTGTIEDGLIGLSPGSFANMSYMPSIGLYKCKSLNISSQEVVSILSLYYSQQIKYKTFGINYCFTNECQSTFTFGGYDQSIVPSIDFFVWFPLVNQFYWSVSITAVFFEYRNVQSKAQTAILDTGTSFAYFDNLTFNTFLNTWNTKTTCGYDQYGWRACYCNSSDIFGDIIQQTSC